MPKYYAFSFDPNYSKLNTHPLKPLKTISLPTSMFSHCKSYKYCKQNGSIAPKAVKIVSIGFCKT